LKVQKKKCSIYKLNFRSSKAFWLKICENIVLHFYFKRIGKLSKLRNKLYLRIKILEVIFID